MERRYVPIQRFQRKSLFPKQHGEHRINILTGSTVSKIVHQSHYAAALESNGQTWNPQHCTPTTTDHASLVERQLVEWTQEVRRAGLSVTRDMIRAQAAVLANKSPSHFLQSVPAASLPQTPPSSVFDAGSTSTLGTYSDPAYTAETSGTDCDIDLLAHELAAIQEEDCSRTPPGQIQNDYLYNVLDYSGAHDPALSLYATSPLSQPYDKGVHPRPICSSSHEKMSDAVCLSEARRAIDTVESYISNTPMVTALDQLCLNHVKTCLYRP